MIERLVPLVWERWRGEHMNGTTRVRVQLSDAGYVARLAVTSSSGNDILDGEAASVLHLGEPYAYISGWIDLDVVFDD